MNSKLFTFFACLAFAAAASVPNHLAVGDLRQAFETEDAIYIPISDEEANHLRLPRNIETLDTLVPFGINVENVDNDHEHTERVRRSSGEGSRVYYDPQTQQGPFLPDERQIFIHGDGDKGHHIGYGNVASHHRGRRDTSLIIETEDAFYLPVSDEEAEVLRFPREVENDRDLESEIFYVPDEDKQ